MLPFVATFAVVFSKIDAFFATVCNIPWLAPMRAGAERQPLRRANSLKQNVYLWRDGNTRFFIAGTGSALILDADCKIVPTLLLAQMRLSA